MAIWRSEISFDHIIATPNPDPAITYPPAFGNPNPAFFTYLGFVVRDGVANQWVVQAGVVPTDSSLGLVTFKTFYNLIPYSNVFGSFDGIDPFTWGFGNVEVSLTAAGAGGYTGGGTIAVVKDTSAGTLTLITPIGSGSTLLTTNDGLRNISAANSTFLGPLGFGLSFSVPQDGVHSPEVIDSRVEFFTLRALLDGVEQFNVPLSAAHPGNFFPITDQSFVFGPSLGDGFGGYNGPGGSDPAVFLVASQLTSRYLMEMQTSLVTYPSFTTGESWRLLATLPPIGYSVDMDLIPEHGVIIEALPDIDDGSTMLARRTFDNGHSYETWTVFQDPTNSDNSPSVTYYNGRVFVDWFDGTHIVQARSLDGGRNWEMPVTIPFTGTNPRRVVDRTGGGSFLFFFDGGNLKVVSTYDGGATYRGPVIIVAATAQQIDAEFMPDSSLVVTINVAGVLTQYRSRDLGVSWL